MGIQPAVHNKNLGPVTVPSHCDTTRSHSWTMLNGYGSKCHAQDRFSEASHFKVSKTKPTLAQQNSGLTSSNPRRFFRRMPIWIYLEVYAILCHALRERIYIYTYYIYISLYLQLFNMCIYIYYNTLCYIILNYILLHYIILYFTIILYIC